MSPQNRPDVILGGGVSGLLVARRLDQLKRNYIMLERSNHVMPEGGGRGFFYLHERILGTEPVIEVRIEHCPNADPRLYAEKVYGDRNVGPVSLETLPAKSKGYFLEGSKLAPPDLSERTMLNFNAHVIDMSAKVVYAKDGRSMPYNFLHSTVPLPVLCKLVGSWPICQNQPMKFNSRTIWVHVPFFGATPKDGDPLVATYCASGCHPWYRRSERGVFVQEEYTEQRYGAFPLNPGKIWLDPKNKEVEKERIDDIRLLLKGRGVYTWGRYGTWTPKMLTHHVAVAIGQEVFA